MSPSPRRAPRRAPGPRFYLFSTLTLMAVAVAGVGLQGLWGENDPLSWKFLAGGIACGLVAIGGVSILSRVSVDGGAGPRGPCAWLAYPMSLFGTLSMVLFLLLAVYPGARSWLDPHSRIETRWRGDRLEIRFPRPTAGNAVNLTLDGTPIPQHYFREHPGVSEWKDLRVANDQRVLVLDIAELEKTFQIPPPERIRINAIAGAQIRESTGQRFPQQDVTLPPRQPR